MKRNAKLCPNYFSVNVSVLAVVFRQQILKKPCNFRQICRFFFFQFVGVTQQLVLKRSQKSN